MSTDILDNWVTQLRKGLLELCVLNALQNGPQYGYDIVKQLRAIEGLMISEGTIYPILSRFRKQGLVETTIEESPEGPPRKYYTLTTRGRLYLAEMNAIWEQIQQGIATLQKRTKS